MEVVARLFEELDEPVLDFDVVVRPRQAEPGGPFERPLALRIELTDEILEIEAGHWSVSVLGKSMIRLVRRTWGAWSDRTWGFFVRLGPPQAVDQGSTLNSASVASLRGGWLMSHVVQPRRLPCGLPSPL